MHAPIYLSDGRIGTPVFSSQVSHYAHLMQVERVIVSTAFTFVRVEDLGSFLCFWIYVYTAA